MNATTTSKSPKQTRIELVNEYNRRIENCKDRGFGCLSCNKTREAEQWLAKAAELTELRDILALELYERFGITV